MPAKTAATMAPRLCRVVWSHEEGSELEPHFEGTLEACVEHLRRIRDQGRDLDRYDIISVATGRFMSWVL